jgi:hypothetical protein
MLCTDRASRAARLGFDVAWPQPASPAWVAARFKHRAAFRTQLRKPARGVAALRNVWRVFGFFATHLQCSFASGAYRR